MAKIIPTLIHLFFLAGTILLLIFLILSGSTNHSPINKMYWLKADTSSIENAYQESQWTFWGVCDAANLDDCLTGPAYPLSPRDNFNTEEGVPEDFINNRSTYYYLSRFAFAFAIIALAISGIVFVISILGFCFEIVQNITVFLTTIGFIAIAGFAAFQTAVNILARDAFRAQGLDASVPTTAMALLWTSVVTLFIVWLTALAATIRNSYKNHISTVNGSNDNQNKEYNDQSSFTREQPVVNGEENTGGIRFFKIKRNQKVDDESV